MTTTPHSAESGRRITRPASPQRRRGPHNAPVLAATAQIEPAELLSGPAIALTAPLGSSAADLTSPSAKPARTVKTSPTGPSAAGRAAVALTGRAGVANHATNPALPSIHYPMTTPGTGCELHAQISEKDSDTRHWHWTRKIANKTVGRYLTHDQAHDAQRWINNDRRIRELLARLEQIGIQRLDADHT